VINSPLIRLAAIGLIVGLPLTATAQPAATIRPEAATTAPAATLGAARREEAAMTQEDRGDLVQARLAELRENLAITPAQLPQWEAYAKTTHDNATEMHTRFRQRLTQFSTMDAATNMNDYAAVSELRAVQLRRVAVSFQALYATLSPQQQRSADEALRSRRTPGAAPG